MEQEAQLRMAAPMTTTTEKQIPEERGSIESIKKRYLFLALSGSPDKALELVESCVRDGWDAPRLYHDVIVAAGSEIGSLWHRGEITTVQEHLVTQVNLTLMDQLMRRIQPPARRGLRAVVACVEGNQHSFAAKVVADFLYLDGWDVDFLGENNPTEDLVDFIKRREPDLVALSVALETQLAAAAKIVKRVNILPAGPQVIVGGPIASFSPESIVELEADGWASDALTAIEEARRLLQISKNSPDLQQRLHSLGAQVQALRKGKGWNQDRLAAASGLDRSYISGVENGKQNLTFGALLKLADGLEVPLVKLLADDWAI